MAAIPRDLRHQNFQSINFRWRVIMLLSFIEFHPTVIFILRRQKWVILNFGGLWGLTGVKYRQSIHIFGVPCLWPIEICH